MLTDEALLEKFEDYSQDGKHPFEQIKKIMDLFEDQITEARLKHDWDVVVAHSFSEVKAAIAAKKYYFIHAIEGAHALGKGLTFEQYRSNLKELFDHYGLAQITLAHFFENDVVFPQCGLPPSIIKLLKINYIIDPNKILSPLGEQMLSYMLDLGIIVDLIHCTPATRNQIYSLNANRANPRPLIFSHTGVRAVVEANPLSDMTANDLLGLPSDDEIVKIAESGGVIGVIWMNYWLSGSEEVEKDIQQLILTIQHIVDLTGQHFPGQEYDFISIGTDLDGFTSVPTDLVSEAWMQDLLDALTDHGFTKEHLDKFSFGNYLRVLEYGWGRKV